MGIDYDKGEQKKKKEFIRSICYDIDEIFHDKGIPVRLVLAMAVLETNYGKELIDDESLRISQALFNIKATSNFKGPTKRLKTALEYYDNGDVYYEDSLFRDYNSQKQSVVDLRIFFDTDYKYKVKDKDGKPLCFIKQMNIVIILRRLHTCCNAKNLQPASGKIYPFKGLQIWST